MNIISEKINRYKLIQTFEKDVLYHTSFPARIANPTVEVPSGKIIFSYTPQLYYLYNDPKRISAKIETKDENTIELTSRESKKLWTACLAANFHEHSPGKSVKEGSISKELRQIRLGPIKEKSGYILTAIGGIGTIVGNIYERFSGSLQSVLSSPQPKIEILKYLTSNPMGLLSLISTVSLIAGIGILKYQIYKDEKRKW